MCGIFGLWGDAPVDPCLAARALTTLRHRGPDDHGALGWDGDGPVRLTRDAGTLGGSRVVLAHRRLSILDLSEAGWQPMTTPDGRWSLVFNGEIYNFVELRAELEAAGHVFRSHSDTEVLLQGWARWGPDVLPRLTGMFAFALLDVRARRVFLARDPFGIKPLYHARWAGGFAFSSEIKALLELPGVGRGARAARVHEYLRGGGTDFGGETMFAGVNQLPAAHWVELPVDGPVEPRPRPYWRLDPGARAELSFDAAAQRLRDLFLDSVRLHLRSDVPVGAALSGGIDSSAIVAAMRHVEPRVDLHTFTFVADDAAVSEERWADVAHAAAGTVAHKVTPRPGELAQELDALIRTQDEPFASTSIYAQQRVFRLAREAGIKVMLDGQGADEMLAGYWPFLLARVGSLVSGGRLLGAASLVRHSARLSHVPARALLLSAAGMAVPERLRPLARRVSRSHTRQQTVGLDRRWLAERTGEGGVPDVPRGRGMLRGNLLHSMRYGLPALLRYEDRNSMAHSIESRVPFLTTRLAEFIFSLPEEYLIDGRGVTKSVFRRAMRGIVPDAILDRRDKVGFATPEARWLESLRGWVDGVLSPDALRAVPVLDAGAVRATWEQARGGTGGLDPRLWRWINLVRWSQVHGVTFD
ncbi:asparagine synthase (glutamine-hydrolyzing) [Longimicrobium sp.]|uniref:asparagine synthase (glutamine-hydrolyzing) n=1 Tax=Longimicrobium sp. TaxID=2029185 RepID=UPI003B3AFAD3